MKSTKPYLIRAIHEWCADQGFTPYLAVKVDATTRVPREFVKDGEIVLNVGLEATHQLLMGNEDITFQARFGGKAFPVVVPIERVAAIYASENGEGMAFEVTERPEAGAVADDGRENASSGVAPAPTPERPSSRPFLTRVK
jgi:stringent starvation protein B